MNLSESEERTMSTQEIVDAAVHNQFGSEVFVWKDGMGDWTLVMNVPELKAAIDAAKKAAPVTSKASSVPRRAAAATKKASPGKAATKTPEPAAVVDDRPAMAEIAPAPPVAPATESGSVRPSAPEQADEKRGPIVAVPGSALAKKMASAKAAAAAPKAEPAPEQPQEPKSEPVPKVPGPSIPVPKAATRLVTKRPGATHDLFAGIDQAGSEIDIDTRDIAAPQEQSKATGARNENSVLFSLDALKSGLAGAPSPAAKQSAPEPRKRAPTPPAKRLEDLMSFDGGPSLMGGGGLLLSGNDALLTAPAPPPPKPEPKPKPLPDAAALAAAAQYVPPRKRTGLIVGIIIGFAVVGTAGVVLGIKFGSKETPVSASAEPSASSKAPASASQSPSANAAASAQASAAEAADAAAPKAVASAAPSPAGAGKSGGGTAVARAATESKPEKKPESKTESSPAGSGSFSKEAAVAALSVAASQATVCKRPEGPWGSGKALVTFAPSGRVTTANIAGAPFGGTPVGGCVANVFRRAKVPAFSGDSVTVSKSFSISP